MSFVDKGAIALSLLVLTCGPILCWRRRDNVAGYIQGGLFFATALVPIFGTTILDSVDQSVVHQYSRILAVGAAAFLLGLLYGAPHGNRCRRPPVTFDRPFSDGLPRWLLHRIRFAALGGLVGLAGSFVLMGYVPLLAADRHSAKYGVGPYAPGFARGSLAYHISIAVATAVTPTILMAAYRHRRHVDLALSAALLGALALTLNRGSAFAGPLVFLVALAVEKRWRPAIILVGVCLAFISGTLVNELLYTAPPSTRPPLAVRVAASAPDISDHMQFLNGFQLQGSQFVGTKTLVAGFNLTREKGYYNPSHYALRIITGLSNIEDLASGGARLPPPLWGYAAYGYVGAAVWSFIAGAIVGFGTTLFRRLLSDVQGCPGQAVNLVVGSLVYVGTFDVFSTFYFPQRVGVVTLLLALSVGFSRRGTREAAPEAVPTG